MDVFGQIIRKGEPAPAELTHRVERHPLEFKTAVVNNKAIDRKRIKKLVGQHHPTNRSIRQIIQRAPAQRQALHLIQPLFLAIPERGAALHKHQLAALNKIGRQLQEGKLKIGRKVSVARAAFHQGERLTVIRETTQQINQLVRQQGGEIRTKGWRGGKVPRRTDLNLTSTVITMGRMVQNPVHELTERNGRTGLFQKRC